MAGELTKFDGGWGQIAIRPYRSVVESCSLFKSVVRYSMGAGLVNQSAFCNDLTAKTARTIWGLSKFTILGASLHYDSGDVAQPSAVAT